MKAPIPCIYPGTYTARALIGENLAETGFTVTTDAKTVYLTGVDNVLTGQVVNLYNGEILSGASVQINQDGVTIYSLTTDDEGWYSQNLPDGEYTVAFSAEGYETKVLELSLSEDKVLNGKLESVPYTINFDANGGSGSMTSVVFHYGQSVTLPACTFTAPVEQCAELTGVRIPGSVTNIYGNAFYDCNALTDVYYNGTQEQWENISLVGGNDALLSATVHFIDS